jgi:hypothetical protein
LMPSGFSRSTLDGTGLSRRPDGRGQERRGSEKQSGRSPGQGTARASSRHHDSCSPTVSPVSAPARHLGPPPSGCKGIPPPDSAHPPPSSMPPPAVLTGLSCRFRVPCLTQPETGADGDIHGCDRPHGQ